MNEIVILSTTDSMELAETIAESVVTQGTAACVNIAPGIRSIYRWEGKICDDAEFLLFIKTSEDRFEQVRETICRLHSYNTPEVIALPITAGDPRYLSWLHSQIQDRLE